MAIESPNTRQTHGVSRRRLVQGVAWATPAILIATAAPAAAASPNVTFSGLTFTPSNNGVNYFADYTLTPNGINVTSLVLTLTMPSQAYESFSVVAGGTPSVSPATDIVTTSITITYGAVTAGTALKGRFKVKKPISGNYTLSVTGGKESDGDTVKTTTVGAFTVA
ncbi:hypothetical protein [Demequina soli]|uniref:hypothetical protein n=1 Tax=Demequina soli TaxID=1638987 RepID=UPI000785A1CA|nr:hypothetical protein [Demequina soli]